MDDQALREICGALLEPWGRSAGPWLRAAAEPGSFQRKSSTCRCPRVMETCTPAREHPCGVAAFTSCCWSRAPTSVIAPAPAGP